MKTVDELEAQLRESVEQVAKLMRDASFMLNEVDWLTGILLGVAKALEMPPDGTLKDVPALAAKLMAELKTPREAEASPGLVNAADTLKARLASFDELLPDSVPTTQA